MGAKRLTDVSVAERLIFDDKDMPARAAEISRKISEGDHTAYDEAKNFFSEIRDKLEERGLGDASGLVINGKREINTRATCGAGEVDLNKLRGLADGGNLTPRSIEMFNGCKPPDVRVQP